MSDTSSERKHYEYIGRTVMQLSNEIDALNNENTKLRELVRELYEMAQPEAPSMFESEFAGRMRELGVEVDG